MSLVDECVPVIVVVVSVQLVNGPGPQHVKLLTSHIKPAALFYRIKCLLFLIIDCLLWLGWNEGFFALFWSRPMTAPL